jgi:long-chain acyl-CoA synthetase
MKGNTIFITGLTGGLGREIAPRILLRDPSAELIALVRGDSDEHVARRREEVVRYLRAYWPEVDPTRLVAVRGDVAEPFFDLEESTYKDLTRRVTHIVHGAASIKLDLPLDCARAINVNGTARVLSFAERCLRVRHLAHISTAYVAGNRTGRIAEEELDRNQGFVNSYERSKFEAESLVCTRRNRLPITVFRPSIVVGDSVDGHIASLCALYVPLRYIVAGDVRTIPGDPGTVLDLVPVDYVAGVLSALLGDPRTFGRTIQVTAGPENGIPVGRLVESSIRLVGGPDLPRLRFVKGLGARNARTSSATSLTPFFAYLTGRKEFVNAGLRDLGVPSPPSCRTYLARLLTFCVDTDWGRRLPWVEEPCRAA